MATRCTSEQLAEAVTIWSIDTNFNQCRISEIEDIEGLKPLDLLISTVRIFLHGFGEKLETECDDYKQGILISKQNFIDYLKHQCLLLSESNGCFDLILTCAFVSLEVCNVTFYFQCFHFSRVAYKLLAKVLEEKFGDMFNTYSGWEELMAFCRKIHAAVLPSKENRPSDYDKEYECPAFLKDSKVKYRTFRKEPAAKELSSEDGLIHQEEIDCSDPDAKVLYGQPINKEMADEKLLFDSKDIVDASEDPNSDGGNKITRGQINHENIKSNQNSQKGVNRKKEGLESERVKPDSKAFEITKETETDSSDIDNLSVDEGSDDCHPNYETTGGKTNLESIKNRLNDLKNMEKEEEQLEFMKEEYKAIFIESDISNETTEETSSESTVTVESSDEESLADDPIYLQYETMKRSILRKRITDSKEHLRDVLDRLAMINRKVNPEIIPSNEYDIPISDNEDIQALEKCVIKPNFSEWQIRLEEEDVECIKKEICDQKNEKLDKLSERRVRPEDITDGEIFQNVIEMFYPPDDEDQCKICDGRMIPFKNKWIEDFHRKFPDNMSAFLIPVEVRNGQEL